MVEICISPQGSAQEQVQYLAEGHKQEFDHCSVGCCRDQTCDMSQDNLCVANQSIIISVYHVLSV